MKLFLLLASFLIVAFTGKSQNTEVDVSELDLMFIRTLDDRQLWDDIENIHIFINDSGQYQIKDSSLITNILHIWLTADIPFHDPSIGTTSSGYIKGKIINGKKEGKWIEARIQKDLGYATVKEMNYTKGQLNGNYYVHSISGDTLIYNKNTKTTSSFINGTGLYLDYFCENGVLKEKGKLKEGKREGRWYFYNKQGNIVKVEIYKNGFNITQ